GFSQPHRSSRDFHRIGRRDRADRIWQERFPQTPATRFFHGSWPRLRRSTFSSRGKEPRFRLVEKIGKGNRHVPSGLLPSRARLLPALSCLRVLFPRPPCARFSSLRSWLGS